MAMKQAPVLPPAKPLSGKHQEEFTTLKRQLNELNSWELAPDSWDAMQIAYTTSGNEKTARAYISAIELAIPAM